MGSEAIAASADGHAVSDEDIQRAQVYGLLAKLLSAPPTTQDLAAAGNLTGGDTRLGTAVSALARIARGSDEAACRDEYDALFIGLGRGELLPYASYYLTGFLHEKPLAKLRRDMSAFGVVGRADVSEPEDHAASILEVMAGLIVGRYGEPAAVEQQQEFFDDHVGSWMPVFFRDLAGASSSVLYAALADVGLRFLEIETEAFKMD